MNSSLQIDLTGVPLRSGIWKCLAECCVSGAVMKQLSVKVVTVVKNKRVSRSKIFVGAQVQ